MATFEKTEFEFPDETEENPRKGGAVVEPETDIEVVDDTPEADRNRKPMEEPPKDVTDEELSKYDESKGMEWLEMQRRRSKLWRDKNPEKVRSYRQAHSDEYRSYMRQYMRQYRQKRRDGGSTATLAGPDSPANS